MSLEVTKISNDHDLDVAFDIRIVVFVDQQKVPMEEEIDQFENDSIHFLAKFDGIPCGAARWRFTETGVKLERFAVLKEYRGKGVGARLVKSVLNDIHLHSEYTNQLMYLNAQIEAVPLYQKFGFKPVGEMFLECDIDHMRMELKL